VNTNEAIRNIAKYDDYYRAMARKITGDYNDADDVVQEMYLRLLNQTYDANFDANKYRFICVRIIGQIWISRKRKTKREFEHDEFPDLPTPSEIKKDRILRNEVGRFLWSVDKFDRYTLYLYAVEGFSIREMESKTGLTRGVIYKSLCRTREKLQQNEPLKRRLLKAVQV
jgi:RNA polymerase sigma factor (sigma-70 family)